MKQAFGNRYQRGISILGLIVALALIGFVAIFASRLIPAYIEYNAIKKAIVEVKQEGGTIRAMQQSFYRRTSVNDVEAVRGTDLVFERAPDGGFDISFAYEKRLPLFANISILIDFAGSTAPEADATQ